jgi:beta-lactam-binding protein with PASTA domain
VPLLPGVNIVDVAAGARARRPAFAALRITRDERVTVPDLGGAVEADVAPRLQALGLEADITRGGGILDVLRSGPRVVCEQRPPSGTRVRRASTVRVLVAKRC